MKHSLTHDRLGIVIYRRQDTLSGDLRQFSEIRTGSLSGPSKQNP